MNGRWRSEAREFQEFNEIEQNHYQKPDSSFFVLRWHTWDFSHKNLAHLKWIKFQEKKILCGGDQSGQIFNIVLHRVLGSYWLASELYILVVLNSATVLKLYRKHSLTF